MRETAAAYKTKNVMITMGDDFAYLLASETFEFVENFKAIMEELTNGEMEFIYSTPSTYMEAVR